MSWDVASIYPHHFPSSWCHLFCVVHQSLLQQSTPTTWCCHPRASRLGWCSSACKRSPFSSKHNDGRYGHTVLFLFHQTIGHFSKKYILCPHVQLQTVVWLFLWRFWSRGFFLAERPFKCRYRTRFTVYIVHSSLGDRTHLLPERYDGCVDPWCLYLCTIVCTDERGTFRHLKIAPKDEPGLQYSFWGLG